MTIRVTVTNQEPEGGKSIEVSTLEPLRDDKSSAFRKTSWATLPPQRSADFYVHLLKDLHVEEQHPALAESPVASSPTDG